MTDTREKWREAYDTWLNEPESPEEREIVRECGGGSIEFRAGYLSAADRLVEADSLIRKLADYIGELPSRDDTIAAYEDARAYIASHDRKET